MNLYRLIGTLLVSFTASLTLAEKVTPKGVGCDTESGACFINLESPFQSKTCTNNGMQLRLNPDKKGSNGQYSAALAAYMSGKKLEVGSVSCYENQPAPSWLYVTD